mgnify:FL=1
MLPRAWPRLFFCAILCMATSWVRAESRFSLNPVAPDRFELDVLIRSWEQHNDAGYAPVPVFPDAVPESAPNALCLPGWVRVLEIPAGRSASVSITESRGKPRDAAGAECHEPAPLVEANVGAMGERIFLRVVVRPVQPDPASNALMTYSRIRAVIRVSDQPVPASSRPCLQSVSGPSGACPDCPVPIPVEIIPGVGLPAEFTARRPVTNDLAWKIAINHAGWYRITGAQLAAAGWPAEAQDTTRMRLSTQSSTLPFERSVHGPMGPTDWIRFYAAPVASSFTTQNVYWLSIGLPSPELPTRSAAPVPGWGIVTTALQRIDLNTTNFYLANYQPLDDSFDHWFVYRVQGGTQSNLPFATPNASGSGALHLSYSFRGFRDYSLFDTNFTGPDHRTILRINNQSVATLTYTGETQVAGTIVTNAALITSALTTIAVSQQVPAGVLIPSYATALIESLQLAYPAHLTASNLPQYIRVPGTQATVRIRSLASTNVVVLDITEPRAPVRLVDLVFSNAGPSWTLSFATTGTTDRCLAVFDAASTAAVASLTRVDFLNLADRQRRADYLAVVPIEFQIPAYRWMKHRQRDRLEVQVATPDDIYHEFSYGIVDPAAIRQYIGYAYHHYAMPRPAYAVLVGNGSFDPTKRTRHSDRDFVPTVQGYSTTARTALDQWFVTVNGVDLDGQPDRLPDLMLGRLPATNAVDVERFFTKLRAYETAPTNSGWFKSALLVADTNEVSNVFVFKQFTQTNTFRHLTNGGFNAQFGIATSYISDKPPAQVRNEINAFIQGGGQVVNYMGHGGIFTWSDVVVGGVWNRVDAEARSNTVYPIFTVFTCRSGAFHEPGTKSLAESIVTSIACGSSCIAPTAISIQNNAERLADGFYRAFAVDRVPRLGEAMAAAHLRLWSHSPFARELLFYSIFGDPAQKIWGGVSP